MKKLIIFDMDGVLVDSEPAITNACIESLSEYGIQAKYEDFKPFTGMGDDKFLAGVAGIYNVEYTPEMKKRAYEIYLTNAKERVKVFPQAGEVLHALQDNGFSLAIASASDKEKVYCNLNCIGVKPEMFCAIITGSDVIKKKPAPDIFIKACQAAGGDAFHSIVIEDAVSGVLAAKAAGMVAIGVKTSFSQEALYEAGADFTVNNLSEIQSIADSVFSVNH